MGDASEVPGRSERRDERASEGLRDRDAVLQVLNRFGIGGEARIRVVSRGSRRAPKFLVEHRGERLLLKRRRPGLGAESEFGAEIQAHLAERGFRVPAVRRTREGRSVAAVDGHAWELVDFVEGDRYPRTAAAAASGGAMLVRLQQELASIAASPARQASFHDSSLVRRTLESAVEDAGEALDAERLRRIRWMFDRYEQSAAEVRPVWQHLPRSLLHGDFHPGNLLFKEDEVVSVLDWEAVREDALLAEFASAAFHFALPPKMLADEHAPPKGLRLDLIRGFAAGYGGVESGLGPVAVDLMAAAAVAEAGFLIAGAAEPARADRVLGAIEAIVRSLDADAAAIALAVEGR